MDYPILSMVMLAYTHPPGADPDLATSPGAAGAETLAMEARRRRDVA